VKAIILSQPKSGTYLCANLLQEFGLSFSGLHISENHYQKYPENYIVSGSSDKFTHRTPIAQSIQLISNNEFAASHLAYSENTENLLTNFKKIVVTRPQSEIEESARRFANDMNRKLILKTKKINEIAKWTQQPDVFHITFDDLINKNIKKIDLLQHYLFGKVNISSSAAINSALESQSMTKSSLR
jgi:hypothetical protein